MACTTNYTRMTRDVEPPWELVTTPDLPLSADSSVPSSRALTTLRTTEPPEVQALWWGPAFVGLAACVGASALRVAGPAGAAELRDTSLYQVLKAVAEGQLADDQGEGLPMRDDT